MWEGELNIFSNRWQLPAFWQRGSAIIPQPRPCPTEGWQPCADQSRLSWGSKASLRTSEGRDRAGRRMCACELCAWAVIFALIFSSEKSSALQGVVAALFLVLCCVEIVFFFFFSFLLYTRLTSATCEQFEKSDQFFETPMKDTLQRSYLCWVQRRRLLSWATPERLKMA